MCTIVCVHTILRDERPLFKTGLPGAYNTTMNHLVLLGDSIFDNRAYVAGAPAVIDQVQRTVPAGWKASLLAVDGDTSVQVPDQINRLPSDCTHLVLSAGGNDAIECLDLMGTPVSNVMGALGTLSKVLAGFEQSYKVLMTELLSLNKPLMVCTIYDSVPGLVDPLKLALALFNDVIIRNAVSRGVPILDLRMICTEPGDYSTKSPIEPSSQGGSKIATKMTSAMVVHDFSRKICEIY